MKACFTYFCDNFYILKVHSLLGLDSVCGSDGDRSFVFVGGAPLSTSTYEYFRSIDVLLCETYGTTELTGPVTNSTPGRWHRPGTVGKPGVGARYERVAAPSPTHKKK